MNAMEQTIWAAVFAAELFKSRDAAEHFAVDKAAKAADFAVSDLARYRRDEEAAMEAAMEAATRPAKSNGKAARS